MLYNIIYIFVLGLLFSSFGSFILNQGTLFLQLKSKYEDQLKHDVYTLHEICLNDEIKNAIGNVNSVMCNEIEERVLLTPGIKAFKEVLNNIHLCGSFPCSSYIKEVLHLLLFDWKIVLILGFLLPLLTKFLLFSKRRKSNNSVYSINNEIPFSSLPADRQYYISTYN